MALMLQQGLQIQAGMAAEGLQRCCVVPSLQPLLD
jgi:hypothetical protein